MSEIKNIVILDDNEEILTYVKKILTNANYSVILFSSAKDYYNFLQEGVVNFDLLLLDLSMPEENGLQVLQKTYDHKKANRYKICVVSGYNDPKVIESARKLKADDYLLKPFKKDLLLSKIRKLIHENNPVLMDENYTKIICTASLINSPVLLNFKIIGMTQESILLESHIEFKKNTDFSFISRELCDLLNLEDDFTISVIATESTIEHQHSKAIFTMNKEKITQKIADFMNQN